jgi:hypothetical protein
LQDPARQVSRMNAESEWIVIEVPELRIIVSTALIDGDG